METAGETLLYCLGMERREQIGYGRFSWSLGFRQMDGNRRARGRLTNDSRIVAPFSTLKFAMIDLQGREGSFRAGLRSLYNVWTLDSVQFM